MWGVFSHLINSFLTDKGVLDGFISVASVSLINFMSKAPEDFKNAKMGNSGQTPLDMTLQMV